MPFTALEIIHRSWKDSCVQGLLYILELCTALPFQYRRQTSHFIRSCKVQECTRYCTMMQTHPLQKKRWTSPAVYSTGVGLASIPGHLQFWRWNFHYTRSCTAQGWHTHYTRFCSVQEIDKGCHLEQNFNQDGLKNPDLLNVQNFTPTGFQENKIYAKKCINFTKFKLRQNGVCNQIYFNNAVFNIRLYKTAST